MARKPDPRTVLIVGASSSIGAPLVAKFVEEGAHVIATHHSPFKSQESGAVSRRPLNLENDASILALSDWIKNGDRRIDVAVFLSGILPGKSLDDYDHELLGRVMAVNFTGQAKLLRALLPAINDGGQVILISSISAQGGSYDPIYAASKGAILSFVKSLAKGLAPRLRVNAIAPGLIEGSPMHDGMSAERRRVHLQETPTGALLRPEDLASIIVDLCAPHWRQLNGECISVNGGRYVR